MMNAFYRHFTIFTLHTFVLLGVINAHAQNSEEGCTDPSAINFDIESIIDDGSCQYLLEGNILSIIYEDLNFMGESNGDEIIAKFDIQNNTNEDLNVYCSRNIITENPPQNWFCWDICYLPNTDISIYPVGIDSGSYSNEFSGHIIPGDFGGNYDIEYCFFAENNIEDSICATVSYLVEGEILGCTDPNSLTFQIEATLDDGSCISFSPPNWDFEITGSNHTIAISTNAEISIDGEPIAIGDYIGVFYELDGELVCGGHTVWDGDNTNIAAQGMDNTTGSEIPGFLSGNEFIWMVWDASTGITWPISVEYVQNLPSQGSYTNNGLSAISSMTNIVPITSQTLNFPIGWSLFSTYMLTLDMDITTVLNPIVENVLIAKDNLGYAYLVEWDFNGLGDLTIGQGYQIKTTQACSLTIDGGYAKPELHPIELEAGWNMVGYLRAQSADATMILGDITANENLLIAKDYMGNAYLPQWDFNGIGDMEPGQGYQIKTLESDVLLYLANNESYRTEEPIAHTNNQPIHFSSPSPTGVNMTLIIPESSWNIGLEQGDELVAYNQNGLMVGSCAYTPDVSVMAVWGDQNSTENKDSLTKGEAIRLMLWKNGSREEILLETQEITYTDNGVVVVEQVHFSNEIDTGISTFHLSPNPADNFCKLKFNLSEGENLNFTIYNLRGEVISQESQYFKKGSGEINLNSSNWTSGIYFCSIGGLKEKTVISIQVLH
jgi:hypothetical protein